jgi:MFS family permease
MLSPAAAEWRRRWPVVLASALGVGLMSVPVYSGGVFIAPLEQAFGWSRGAISSGLMINALVAVSLGPWVGHAIDRYGPRRFALAGAVILCGAIALLGALNASLWSWWAIWALIAVGAVCIHPMVWTSAVSSFFTVSRGLALAVTLCGTSLASFVCPVLGSRLIALYGWRMAYVGLAVFFALLVIPPLFLFFTSARDERGGPAVDAAAPANLPGVRPREGLLSFRFARLLGAATCMALAAVTCVTSLVPILTWSGQSRAAAAGIAGAAGLSTIAGRLTAGWLLDRVSGALVAGVSVSLPIAAFLLLLLARGSAPAATAAALVLGLSLGAELDTVAYLTTRHFGLRSFGLLFGVIGASLNLAIAVGPFLASLVYDATGSYAPVLWAFIPVAALGGFLFSTLGAYPDFEPAGASAPATAGGPPDATLERWVADAGC